MHLALRILDVQRSSARQQPSVIVVMNIHDRAVRQMDVERLKRLCAQQAADLVGEHGASVRRKPPRRKSKPSGWPPATSVRSRDARIAPGVWPRTGLDHG